MPHILKREGRTNYMSLSRDKVYQKLICNTSALHNFSFDQDYLNSVLPGSQM